MPASPAKRVLVRPMRVSDIEAVRALQRRCFPGIEPWDPDQLISQIQRFGPGQLCVEYGGKLVATSSSLLVDGEDFAGVHTYGEASDDGYIRNHDPDGDTLYGIDIAVDPALRGMRLARRIYEARKELAREHNLRAILIAGRIPGYHRHAASMTADEYVRRVMRKELKDPVMTAQLANGFAVREVIVGYLPNDKESCGHAVLMEWLNPGHTPESGSLPRTARVAAVQYQMRNIPSFDAFAQQCAFFIEAASEYRADFVLFPELLTNQLQALVTAPGSPRGGSTSSPSATSRRSPAWRSSTTSTSSRAATW